MNELTTENATEIWSMLTELAFEYAPPLVLAIVTLLVGLRIIKSLTKVIGKTLSKRNTDATLIPFIVNLTNWLLKIVLIVSVASMVGIQTASFVAILGAAGLAVGLALQGTLQNFAGGVLILLQKPFAVGDFVEAGGYSGTVEAVEIFVTKLRTPQNRLILIPNGTIANGSIMNLTSAPRLRVDLVAGIGYSSDIAQAKTILADIAEKDPRVLKDPATQIAVSELADSSVNIVFRPWVNTADYWPVYFDLTEQIKLRFDEAGIEIPFPQRSVHQVTSGD